LEAKDPKPHFQVAAALIWREGKLLITSRPEGRHLAGFWEFPGGKQEEDETLQRCLEREIKEELGIEIRADERLLSIQHEYEAKRITLHVFHCRDLKGRPLAREGQEARWVLPEDLPNYRFPPPDLKVVDILLHDRITGAPLS
jgi:mutator protein MutT